MTERLAMIRRTDWHLTFAVTARLGIDPEKQRWRGLDADCDLWLWRFCQRSIDDIHVPGRNSVIAFRHLLSPSLAEHAIGGKFLKFGDKPCAVWKPVLDHVPIVDDAVRDCGAVAFHPVRFCGDVVEFADASIGIAKPRQTPVEAFNI